MPKYVPKLEGIMHDPEFDKDLSVSIPPYLLWDMTIFRLRLYNNAPHSVIQYVRGQGNLLSFD